MAYQRAGWHSGLTYQQTCPQCNTIVQYQDDKLDFRPWFADGFIYCPTCKKPLRHNENLAITFTPAASAQATQPAPEPAHTPVDDTKRFCTNCGKALSVGDRFCSSCGKKVE